MMMLIISVYILMRLSCDVQGELLLTASEFKDGDVIFTWTNISLNYHVLNQNTTGGTWVQGYYKTIQSTEYTVQNALRYDSIFIKVSVPGSEQHHFNTTFKVNKVRGREKSAVNVSWTASYFPQTGTYSVFQHRETTRNIFQVEKTGVLNDKSNHSTKYRYITRPNDLTNISFEIRNLSLDDAGYYSGGATLEEAKLSGGAVLIIASKPSKPNITGNVDVEETQYITLTCSSNSTSAPEYYSRLVTLSYTWFVNDSKNDRETRKTLNLYVTRDLKYNRYSCTATEEDLESEKSDPVQINPLYGPDEIKFYPNAHIGRNEKLTLREGETTGPYQCIADCNPQCNITWKYIDAKRTPHVIDQRRNVLLQNVTREMKSVYCVAEWKSQPRKEIGFSLDVQYLDKPVLFMNNKTNSEPIWFVKENVSLSFACLVDGNPIPDIRLFKGHAEIEIITTKSKWANYTVALCEDTENYTCVGKSNGFNVSRQTVKINITCTLRIDKNGPLQTNYSSTSGENVKVELAIPVIANPPPQASDITWMGPTDNQIKSRIFLRDVVYKHWINTSIPIHNHSNFGHYVIKYKNTIIHNITINAQDRPETPLDFMADSYASGKVNLTWTSGFNGGSEQFFILMMGDGSNWKTIANLTDPGKGKTVFFDPGPLTPGQEIWYRLHSCNILNCSIQYAKIKVNIKEISKAFKIGTAEIVGASTGVFILIVSLTVVFAIFFRRKNKTERHNVITENEITQEGAEMYAVVDKQETSTNRNVDKAETSGATKDAGEMYAAVDKSLLKGNKTNAVVLKDDIPNEKDENLQPGAEMYSVVDKSLLKSGKEPRQTTKLATAKKTKRKKEWKNGSLEEKNEASVGSRKTNDEGLIYIDVDFTNKPESTDTKQKPVIHGEEDRTEYTFVDFSKKAPPTQETRDFEGKQDEG